MQYEPGSRLESSHEWEICTVASLQMCLLTQNLNHPLRSSDFWGGTALQEKGCLILWLLIVCWRVCACVGGHTPLNTILPCVAEWPFLCAGPMPILAGAPARINSSQHLLRGSVYRGSLLESTTPAPVGWGYCHSGHLTI